MEEMNNVLDGFKSAIEHFKYDFKSEPDCYFIQKDTLDSWETGLKNKIFNKSESQRPQIV